MLNSASAAAFISERSVGTACQGLPAATARKEKNGLHRAPLLKSTLGQSREVGPEEGPEEGGPRSRDAARSSQSGDSESLLTSAPRPITGPRGAGRARACAERRRRGWAGRT